MKQKQFTKKLLSLVLVACMIVGMFPATVVEALAASGNVVDAAIFCSDVHGSPSAVTSVFNGIKSGDSTFSPSTASFVGDTDYSTSTVTSNAQSVFSGVECIYAYGSHDSGYVTDFTGVSYGANHDKNYYIYTISQSSMESSNPSTSGFTTAVAGMDQTKPLFIISHMPLHARRGDNSGAADWYSAISAAAEKMDIVFFWAHNHTGESSTDTNAYYVAKDGTETMSIQGGSTVTPNFTYMNAGYIDANGQNPGRKPVATTVKIYSDALVFQDYTTSGAYTNSSYSHNVEVAREFAGSTAEVTLSSIAVTTAPAKTTYNVDDTFSADGLVVTATYSNGSTAAVTGYTLSDVDMTTAGTKTVTVTYTEGDVTKTTSFDITVQDTISATATPTGIKVTGAKTEYTLGETLSTAGMVVTATYDDNGTTKTAVVTDYTVSEVDLTTEGEKTVTVSYTYNGKTVTATYVVTVVEAESNEVTLGGSGEEKDVYILVDSITSGEEYLIVNTNSAGTGYGLGNTTSGDHAVTITSGTLTIGGTDGTYTYIEDKGDALEWTATGSNSSVTFASGSYKLGTSSSGGSRKLTVESSSSWVFADGDSLYYDGQKDYYIAYSNGSWGISSSNTGSRNVYLYQKQTINTSTEVTYTMRAEDLTKVVTDTSKTADLSYCLQGNGADLTTLPSGGSYSFTVLSDESGIIDSIDSDGTVNFTGTTGTAKVKVAYTWTQDSQTYTVYKNITVEASEPYYTLDITKGGTVVSGTTITEKGVTSTTTLQLGTQITYTTDEGTETLTTLPEGATLEWEIPVEYQSVATIDQNGLITFEGVDGAFYVLATLTVNDKDYTVGVNISATTSQYSVPTDGTTDFPEYPNEGAIRFDKTATAVGNFSETGIAQVELSMTGVPYTTGSEIDVVVMLDMTGSMTTASMAAAEAAALAFARQIILNEDGTYNNNRISVQVFSVNGVTELWAMSAVTNDTYNSLVTAIESASDNQAGGGTPYSTALSGCKDVLDAAKKDGIGNNRQQFCVFVSDGTPTSMTMISNYDAVKAGTASAYTTTTSSSYYGTYPEYYSTLMKDNGVTVYGVYTSAAAGSSGSGGGSVNDTEEGTAIMKTVASSDDKVYTIDDYTDTSALTGVFTNIAQDILQAATDITVEDKITDEYTMIFGIPTDTKYNHAISLSGQEFYIEFLKYTLDSTTHERVDTNSDGDTYDDAESVTKLYLIDSNGDEVGGTYSAGSSATTAYAAPTFAASTIGDKGTQYYWTTDSSYAAKAAVSYNDGTNTYYFIPYGVEENEDGTAPDGWYNMTAGAYAYGTIDSVTNTSVDLVIATPYFVYNASTKMLYWTVDKLDTTEYALRYFLYLDDSATDVGETTEVDPATYPTNDHAYITYTNFKGNDCRQEFPVPQLTWNGAQVSYVFYLVNSAGQPINKSGQVVDFANATFVTDVFTKSVVWNKEGDTATGTGELSADWLANTLLPDSYTVYDEAAGFKLNVYEKADGTTIKNQFTIEGATAENISSSLNTRLNLSTTASTVSTKTTKVYNTKAGEKIVGYGTYYSTDANMAGIDFSNTTVAFAVVWEPKLVEDVVVVDFGLDVVINVVMNDLMQNTISGIGLGKDAYGSIKMNTGVSTDSMLGTAALTIDGNTVSIENENSVRFSQGDMTFSEPVVFYYESPVEYYEGSDKQTGYMYSSVTVIPATSIYYEDCFVMNLTNAKKTDSSGNVVTDKDGNPEYVTEGIGAWTQVGKTTGATQDVDRPGLNQIGNGYDADNIYGYDSAYTECTQYSLGSAMKVTVDMATGKPTTAPTANFTFTGTGFDLISLTDSDSGTIIVSVYKSGTTERVSYMAVDNYYGYTYSYYKTVYTYDAATGEWTSKDVPVDSIGTSETVPEDPVADPEYVVYGESKKWIVVDGSGDSIWQVPVIKVEGLSHGTYDVVIQVAYMPVLDHQGDGSYSFWLDAIRVYDPTDNNNDVANGAYGKDGELNPSYITLKELLVTSEKLTEGIENYQVGVVFIDGITNVTDAIVEGGITDYNNPGPNNETYLAKGQGVSFKLVATEVPDSVHLGVKLATGSSGTLNMYTLEGTTAKENEVVTVTTATDMYYELPLEEADWSEVGDNYESKVIVLSNGAYEGESSDATSVISITNLKAVGAKWNGDFVVDDTSDTETETANIEQETQTNNAAVYGLTKETVEQNAGKVMSVMDNGNGFRIVMSGVRDSRSDRSQQSVVFSESAYNLSSASAATTTVAEEALITAVVDGETVETVNTILELLRQPEDTLPEWWPDWLPEVEIPAWWPELPQDTAPEWWPNINEGEIPEWWDEFVGSEMPEWWPNFPTEPEAPQYFVPESVEMEWKSSWFGKKQTLTITTSDDVAYITVNGQKIYNYQVERLDWNWFWSFNWFWNPQGASAKRVWTYTVYVDDLDDMTFEVVAYNAAGQASEVMQTKLIKRF